MLEFLDDVENVLNSTSSYEIKNKLKEKYPIFKYLPRIRGPFFAVNSILWGVECGLRNNLSNAMSVTNENQDQAIRQTVGSFWRMIQNKEAIDYYLNMSIDGFDVLDVCYIAVEGMINFRKE